MEFTTILTGTNFDVFRFHGSNPIESMQRTPHCTPILNFEEVEGGRIREPYYVHLLDLIEPTVIVRYVAQCCCVAELAISASSLGISNVCDY